jgi:hypothetical protein
MGDDTMGEVDFNNENVMKCLCTGCPVQGTSECVKGKIQKMQEMMAEDIDIATVIGPEDVPGLYCASGEASCTDLYYHEECQCPQCPVFKENELADGKPVGYYCRDGKAD